MTFRIFFWNSDNSEESGFFSIDSKYTKKRKSCAIREEDLTKEEKMRAEVITTICAKYKRNVHITPCYI